jgi:hypothetical protein
VSGRAPSPSPFHFPKKEPFPLLKIQAQDLSQGRGKNLSPPLHSRRIGFRFFFEEAGHIHLFRKRRMAAFDQAIALLNCPGLCFL